MKNNNRFFKNFKQWGLKVSVSSVIFVSVVILGGAIITLASPSSLNDVKSNRANYQLTAENWDYVVDQMNGAVSNLIHLSGKVSTTITNIINLNGKFDELSGNIANTTGIV
ncbi:MAG: hypothetical protein LBG59_09820 [Candidatus Peribacteria bacterium]|nr:hypothetical protein [Candidatus Peribacteria bacterium]